MPSNLLNELPGLTKSKLTLATATENDVVTGKTFYSGDKTLKTGTYQGILLNSENITKFDLSHGKGMSYSVTYTPPYGSYMFTYIYVNLNNYSASENSTGRFILSINGETITNESYYRPGGPTKQEWYKTYYLQDKWRSGVVTFTISSNSDEDAINISGICVGKI